MQYKAIQFMKQINSTISKFRNIVGFDIPVLILLALIHPIFNHAFIVGLLILIMSLFAISRSINNRFFNTKVSSFVLATVYQYATIVFFAAVLWIFNIRIPLWLILVISALILCFLLRLRSNSITNYKEIKLISLTDIYSLLLVALLCGMYVFGVYHSGSKESLQDSLVRSTMNGLDDQSHFNMFRDEIIADNGLLLGDKDSNFISVKEYTNYAKASHLVGATISSQIEGLWLDGSDKQDTKAYDELIAYVGAKTAMFCVAIFLIIRLGFSMIAQRKKNLFIVHSIYAILIFSVVLFFMAGLYMDGFYSFIPIFGLIIAFITQFIGSKGSKKNQLLITSNAMLVALLAVAMMLTWQIIGIIAIIYTLYVLICDVIKSKYSRSYLIKVLIPTLLVMSIGLVQLVAQFSGNQKINVSIISATGGILPISLGLLGISVLGFLYIVYRMFSDNKETDLVFNRSYLLVVILLLFACVGIYIYQLGSYITPQYYFFKTLYIPFILMVIYILAYISSSICDFTELIFKNKYHNNAKFDFINNLVAGVVITITLLGILIVVFPQNTAPLFYLIKGTRTVSISTASNVIRLLKSERSDSTREVFTTGSNWVETIMSSHTLKSGQKLDPCLTQVFKYQYENKATTIDNVRVFDPFGICASNGIKTIIVNGTEIPTNTQ